MEFRRFLTALVAFSILLSVGTVGYRLIEGEKWSYLDGLFMTVITLATVGYSETHPLSDNGRIFTIILLFVGAGLMAYTVTSLAQFVIEGKFRELWGKRLMKEKIKAMTHHYILCGAGNTGMVVAQELIKKDVPLVVIDANPKVVQELLEQNIPAVEGDATLDEILVEVGLERANGLVTALPHDADNVFVTLTAKGVNSNIFII